MDNKQMTKFLYEIDADIHPDKALKNKHFALIKLENDLNNGDEVIDLINVFPNETRVLKKPSLISKLIKSHKNNKIKLQQEQVTNYFIKWLDTEHNVSTKLKIIDSIKKLNQAKQNNSFRKVAFMEALEWKEVIDKDMYDLMVDIEYLTN